MLLVVLSLFKVAIISITWLGLFFFIKGIGGI